MKPLKYINKILTAILLYALIFMILGFIFDFLYLKSFFNLIFLPYSFIISLGINGWYIYYVCLAILIITDTIFFFEMEFFKKFLKYGLSEKDKKKVTLFWFLGLMLIFVFIFTGYVFGF